MTHPLPAVHLSSDVTCLSADGPDGLGRIGVQMGANAEIVHINSKGPLDTVKLAANQFGKLTKTVVFGEPSSQHHVLYRMAAPSADHICLMMNTCVCCGSWCS